MLKLVIILVVAISSYLLKRKLDAASAEPISDDECVACGSRNLASMGPGAYACQDCDYQGGSGQAKQAEHRRQDRVAALSAAERAAALEAHLLSARRVLAVAATEDPLAAADGPQSWELTVSSALAEGAAELEKAAALGGGLTRLTNGFEINPAAIEQSIRHAMNLDDLSHAQPIAQDAADYIEKALDRHSRSAGS